MSIRGVFFAAAAFALALRCGGNGVETAAMPTDADIVGDWLISDGNNEKGYISLKASGELSEGVLRKVDGFWVAGLKEGAATWGAARARSEFYIKSSVWTDTLKYDFFGDSIVTASCYTQLSNEYGSPGPICFTRTLRRVDPAALRGSLGTVFDEDRGLYASTAHADLVWRLGDAEMDFDAIYFNKRGAHYGVGNVVDGVWYTSGSKLVLLDVEYYCGAEEVDCEAAEANRAEAAYGVAGSGDAARLTVNGDAWQPGNQEAAKGGGAWKPRRAEERRAFSPLAELTGGR